MPIDEALVMAHDAEIRKLQEKWTREITKVQIGGWAIAAIAAIFSITTWVRAGNAADSLKGDINSAVTEKYEEMIAAGTLREARENADELLARIPRLEALEKTIEQALPALRGMTAFVAETQVGAGTTRETAAAIVYPAPDSVTQQIPFAPFAKWAEAWKDDSTFVAPLSGQYAFSLSATREPQNQNFPVEEDVHVYLHIDDVAVWPSLRVGQDRAGQGMPRKSASMTLVLDLEAGQRVTTHASNEGGVNAKLTSLSFSAWLIRINPHELPAPQLVDPVDQ